MQSLDPQLHAFAMREGKVSPLPPDLAANLRDIAVAKELGIPATDVRRLPLDLFAAALTRIEAERQMSERQNKKRSARR